MQPTLKSTGGKAAHGTRKEKMRASGTERDGAVGAHFHRTLSSALSGRTAAPSHTWETETRPGGPTFPSRPGDSGRDSPPPGIHPGCELLGLGALWQSCLPQGR